MRGLWLKICIDSAPRSSARSSALTRPPAIETWAPISICRRVCASIQVRAQPDRVPPHRRRADGTLQLAAGAQSPENALVLRLEDTDRERSTDEAIDQILDALRWLEPRLGRGPAPPDRALRPLRRAPASSCSSSGCRLLGHGRRRRREAGQGGVREERATAGPRSRRERRARPCACASPTRARRSCAT